jgi:hypothetical protein
MCPEVIHVMFALFCQVLGRFGKMICRRPIIIECGGLQNDLPSGRPDVVFLANDLNSDLGRRSDLFRGKSALIFSRTSRDRAVMVHCTVEGTTTDRFGGPPINRTTQGGVDPIPFVFLRCSRCRSHCCRFLSRVRRSDLATAVLSCLLAQLPTPARLELAPPPHAVLLGVCASRPCVTLDPTQTLAVRWRRRRRASRTRGRRGSGRR